MGITLGKWVYMAAHYVRIDVDDLKCVSDCLMFAKALLDRYIIYILPGHSLL